MKLAEDYLALTPAKVATAVERMTAACQPLAILAFGSRARQQARHDSDLDLLVIVPSPAPDRLALRRRLRSLLADLPFAKDILVSDPEHLAGSRTQSNSVYRSAVEEGLTLWREGRLIASAAEQVCLRRHVRNRTEVL